MEYHVCEANSVAELQDEVNRYIQKGWRPLGGIEVIQSTRSSSWWFYQAMVIQSPDAGARRDWDLA